jgi:hypothetical protein
MLKKNLVYSNLELNIPIAIKKKKIIIIIKLLHMRALKELEIWKSPKNVYFSILCLPLKNTHFNPRYRDRNISCYYLSETHFILICSKPTRYNILRLWKINHIINVIKIYKYHTVVEKEENGNPFYGSSVYIK